MADKKYLIVFIFCLSVCITGLSTSPSIHADSLNTGILLADDQGKILYSQNRKKQFVPASILKILTSLAAINILGENYYFPTDYFFDPESKNLYIKGFGDPLFTSEVIELMCQEIILTAQIKHINNIILDQTYFSEQIQVPGKGNSLNPYDAPVGALCANFNTIKFKWNNKTGRFISGEPQTPLLTFFHKDIKRTKLKKGRIILSRHQSLLYPGLLIKYFLEKNNIKITGSVLQGSFKVKSGEEHSFLSPFEIKEIVQKLLKYSNNYIANQLLLAIGVKSNGAPATLEKGIQAVRLFASKSLGLHNFTILEGSGLSRSNLISPDQMMKVLIKFMPYYSLLKNQGNEYFKTGTLFKVRTRAGYIIGKDNRLYPYVIMVNKKNKSYDSILKNLILKVSQL